MTKSVGKGGEGGCSNDGKTPRPTHHHHVNIAPLWVPHSNKKKTSAKNKKERMISKPVDRANDGFHVHGLEPQVPAQVFDDTKVLCPMCTDKSEVANKCRHLCELNRFSCAAFWKWGYMC